MMTTRLSMGNLIKANGDTSVHLRMAQKVVVTPERKESVKMRVVNVRRATRTLFYSQMPNT